MAFKTIDILLSIIRKENPDFSYRFNSNAKTVHFKSLFLEEHPEFRGKLDLKTALDDSI